MKMSLQDFVSQLTPGYIYGWAKNRDARGFVPYSGERCLVISCVRDHGFPTAVGHTGGAWTPGSLPYDFVGYSPEVSALARAFDVHKTVDLAFAAINR
jgi:hypothetical protein